MDIRQVKEHLGRVKPYYLKNETMRALNSLISGLRGALALPGGLPMAVRSPLREAVQMMARDQHIKKRLPVQLMYNQGQERQLLATLMRLRDEIEAEMATEDPEAAEKRKMQLDQALNQGLRHLEAGKIPEADASFQEAVGFYRDEHRVFMYIGKSLIAAGAAKRALPYLRKGLEVAPEDAEMAAALEQAAQIVRGSAE